MSDHGRILQLARKQLDANRHTGVSAAAGGIAYDFVCPSASHYPFQWFWDSCFHAIALTHIDQRLAEQELLCLLQGGRADGFMPHLLLWEPAAHREAIAAYNLPELDAWTTETIQPPVLATAVRRVWEAGRSRTFLNQALPPTVAFFDWLATNRDPDHDGLISILQPDESGLDASPKYDEVLGLTEPTEAGLRAAMDRLFRAYEPLRPDDAAMLALDVFNVEDVMVNSIYADGQRDLALLCREAGEPRLAERFAARSGQTETSLLERCWDPDRRVFWDLAGASERPATVLTVTSLFPLILARLPRPIVESLVTNLTDAATFWTAYPCPSVARSEPAYSPCEGIIWRGPTWLNTNWFLVRGLRRHGYTEVADQIARKSRELVLRHGFREYYNPETGEPAGARGFSWSTLVVNM